MCFVPGGTKRRNDDKGGLHGKETRGKSRGGNGRVQGNWRGNCQATGGGGRFGGRELRLQQRRRGSRCRRNYEEGREGGGGAGGRSERSRRRKAPCGDQEGVREARHSCEQRRCV